MVAFEKYHPLLSAHYTFDWLTMSKLKDLFALRADAVQAAQSAREVDHTITETAHYVNRAMHAVMSNQALIYGVTARADHALAGTVALMHITEPPTTAELQVELLPHVEPPAYFAEVLPRIIGFAFFELGLTTLTLILSPKPSPLRTWLGANGFDAAESPLTITKAQVADDPRYRF